MNFINGTLTQETGSSDVYFEFCGRRFKLPKDKAEDENLKPYIGKEVVAGIRPELLHDEPIYLGQFPDSTIEAYVDFTELMGSRKFICISLLMKKPTSSAVSLLALLQRAVTRSRLLSIPLRIHFFDKDTEQIIVH